MDRRGPGVRCDTGGGDLVVQPPTDVLCPGLAAVAPPRVAFGVWVEPTKDIDETKLVKHPAQPGALLGQKAAKEAKFLETGRQRPVELTALLEAIRWASTNGVKATIYTDSMYAINCTTKWGPSWSKKGWKRDSGEPLQNLDLIKPLVAAWNPTIPLVHVRGHQTGSGPAVHGNNWVDRAAVAAAKGEEIHTVASPTVLALEIPGPEEDSDTIQHIMAESMRPEKPEKLPKIIKTLKAEKPKVLKQADLRTWF
jgi:ribonuclease HI